MKQRILIPRFGIRTLIVVLTLVAIWMGVIGRRFAAVNAEHRCIAEMKASGVHFSMQSYSLEELSRADWLIHWPAILLKGESAIKRNIHVDVSWARGLTPDLEFVHQFSKLKGLWLNFETMPENGFAPLQSHPLLSEVYFGGGYELNETEVRQLLKIPNIAVINFFWPQIASVESFYELKKHDIEIVHGGLRGTTREKDFAHYNLIDYELDMKKSVCRLVIDPDGKLCVTGDFWATDHELHPQELTTWSMSCFELKRRWLEDQTADESQTLNEWGNIYDGLHEAPLDNVLELEQFEGTWVQMRWSGRTDGVSAMKQDFHLEAKVACDSVSVYTPAEYSRQQADNLSAKDCIASARKQLAAHFDLSTFKSPQPDSKFPVLFKLNKSGSWILKKP